MIKVLHFVSTPSIGSGVMSVIMNYYRHMDRSEIQFDFLCFIPCEDSYEEEINGLGGRVFFISIPGFSAKAFRSLWDFFRSHQGEYQWLHNHEVYLSFLLKPLSHCCRIPGFIIHSHATQYSDRAAAAARNRILCMPIRFMRCEKLACSYAAGSFLYGKAAMKTGHIKVLYNAVDSDQFQFDAAKRKRLRLCFGITDDELVLGHIGRFALQKNHAFLLDIFKACQQAVSRYRPTFRCRLLCIGGGPLMGQMREKASRLGISDKILFLGQRSDVPDLLNLMDVFLLPSFFEGSPVSLVEACCNGLSCVISDTIQWEVPSEQVCALSLQAPVESWADKALELAQKGRREGKIPASFDIREQAQKLAAIYQSPYKLQAPAYWKRRPKPERPGHDQI